MSDLLYSHDEFFRDSMRRKPVALEFFQQHLPESIQVNCDFSSLELCNDSFVESTLGDIPSGIIYSVKISDQTGYLYLLCEYQSQPDPLIAFRMIKYSIALMDQHLKEHQSQKLPLVYPMVFYNGSRKYNAALDIEELIDAPDTLIGEHLFKPTQLIDVSGISDEELRHYTWSGVMQFFIKNIYKIEIILCIVEMKDILMKIDDIGGKDYIINILRYSINCGNTPDIDELWHVINENFRSEVSTMAAKNFETYGERCIRQGQEIGRQDGLQEGIQEGQLKAKRDIAMTLLRSGSDINMIVRVTGLSRDIITQLLKELSASS